MPPVYQYWLMPTSDQALSDDLVEFGDLGNEATVDAWFTKLLETWHG